MKGVPGRKSSSCWRFLLRETHRCPKQGYVRQTTALAGRGNNRARTDCGRTGIGHRLAVTSGYRLGEEHSANKAARGITSSWTDWTTEFLWKLPREIRRQPGIVRGSGARKVGRHHRDTGSARFVTLDDSKAPILATPGKREPSTRWRENIKASHACIDRYE